MRKWEDIVKDKLEGYESPLPAGSLADFRARRDGGASTPATKRFPLVWALAPALAVLAAVLFLRQPAAPEEGIRLVQQPAAQAVAADSSAVAAAPEAALTARAEKPQVAKPQTKKAQPNASQTVKSVQPAPATEEPEAEAPVLDEAREPEQDQPAPSPERVESPDAPFVPADIAAFLQDSQAARKPAKMSVGKAAGMLGGGSLLTAAALALAGPQAGQRAQYGVEHTSPYLSSDSHPGSDPVLPDSMDHGFPLRLGISARFPLAGQLSLTTGLDYSSYTTWLGYNAVTVTQRARYLGVPVRLDWTLASNDWLEIYVGGGLEGDFCLAATFNDRHVSKDGFALSLLGAGGFQFKLSERLGLFVEPQLSWTLPSSGRVLQTYRTQHPLTFSFNGGIRITFTK